MNETPTRAKLSTAEFDIQSMQYAYPYHYIPDIDNGAAVIYRELQWGLDYLSYMLFAVDLISKRIKPESLIDIGCGDGRLVQLLDGAVPSILGVDPVPQAIGLARAMNPGKEFYLGEMSEVTQRFECATLIEVMEHIPDSNYPTFIQQVAETLVPNGRLVVSVPTTNVALNRKHHRHYDLELLKSQLACCFEIEEHWFISKKSFIASWIQALLINRFVIVRPKKWRRFVWSLHKRYAMHADATNGRHLVAIAKRNG